MTKKFVYRYEESPVNGDNWTIDKAQAIKEAIQEENIK